MTILYFTSTGNNLYLAKRIGGKLISIPKAIKENTLSFKDDRIGIIVPVYGQMIPPYVQEFLKTVKFDSPYIFGILSYGQFAGNASGHLKDFAFKNGFAFNYISTIKMVDNYLPIFDMDNQIKKEEKKKIEYNLNNIIEDLENKKNFIQPASLIAKLYTSFSTKFYKFSTGSGIVDKYSIEDGCTMCGVCSKVCPTNNIKLGTSKPGFGNNCITCLACTHNCPNNVIRLKSERSRTRFINTNVTLDEIIQANN